MRRLVALILAVLVAATACSGPTEDGTFGDNKPRDRKERQARRQEKKKVTPKAAAEIKRLATASPGAAPKPDVAAPAPTPVDTSDYGIGPQFTTGKSLVDDPDSDATKQGLTPTYSEIIEASVEGFGESFRLTLTLAGDPPDRMPDDKTFMIVAFGMRGRRQSATFGAQATEEGWKPYAGKSESKGKESGKGSNKYPGEFRINGNVMVFTIPWSYLGGGFEFEWQGTSAWFASVASTTHYAYDTAPNQGDTAHYPQ